MTQYSKEQADKAYQEGNPLMTDAEYDKTFGIDASDIDSEFENSNWPIVDLTMFMGSLKKIKNNVPQLLVWADKYCSEWIHWSDKLDGSSGELTYINGKLHAGKTRGDGKRGNDVTPNVMLMQVPKEIDELGKAVVRVEYILHVADWKKHMSDKKTCRGGAAGAVNKKDGTNCQYIKCIAFDIEVEGKTFTTKNEKKDYLKSLGFEMPSYGKIKRSDVAGVKKLLKSAEEDRLKLPYEIDGMVLEADDIEFFDKQGVSDKRPRGSRAFKFLDVGVKTIINEVIWQVGKTGFITPVALLEPTDIGGVTVERVMLNNPSMIAALELGIGCEAELIRSNEVIPKITKRFTKGKLIEIPKVCPSCQCKTHLEQTVKKELVILEISDLKTANINKEIADQKYQLKCSNLDECPAQGLGRIVGFLQSLDVKGFKEKTVEKLLDAGLIETPADLYAINTTKFAELEGLSDKIVDKLLKELHNKSAKATLPMFIKSLTISGFSASSTEKVMKGQFKDLESLRKATVEELESIDKIGNFKATCLVEGLKRKSDLIDKLLPWVPIQGLVLDGKLSGKSFCFTGFRDNKAEAKIKELGGEIKASATKDLNYLVAKKPDGKSSKLEKARKNGSEVIGIDEMLNMIGE